VVIEATLIVESGNRSFYDLLVVVVAGDGEKVRRAVARGMTEGEARRRLALLIPDAEKMEQASLVVENSGSLDELSRAADRLAGEIGRMARARRGATVVPEGPAPEGGRRGGKEC
jgi:dephospho-CoA kinase